METTHYYDIVHDSYSRCAIRKKFFDDFYDTFMSSSPQIAYMFRKSDMEKQKKLLDNGVTMMIMFAGGNAIGKIALDHIAKIHRQLNVTEEYYNYWLESLLQTLKKHDPQYSFKLERAWKEVMGVGIDYLISNSKMPSSMTVKGRI
ncbi:globin [bacterium]|nr:globin [bacterium]